MTGFCLFFILSHDGLNIARAAYAIDPNVLKTEINKKGNAIFKPTDFPLPRLAPLLAASIIPGPHYSF